MKNNILSAIFSLFIGLSFSQSISDFALQLNQLEIENLQGLHSYAYAQYDGKWLIVGGRKDGLHARQPFNAFPVSQNNTDVYVIDIGNNQFWSKSLNSLTDSIAEQLQSTNMNFYQIQDTLYFIGGYAFANSANDHITFPKISSIIVSDVINAVINNQPFDLFFKQIEDQRFAVTGGQLNNLNNTFYLVGGHRFNGRYNPMGNPTYDQTYTNSFKKFKLNNSGSSIVVSEYEETLDPIHLRRRDYNLAPQIFPNGEEGFTIFSGVFQQNADLPFLYPVDINENNFTPITEFNQYLSCYHGAKISIFDSINNEMHSIFFGGMAQYYYDENDNLIQDDNVPFVKTISMVSRDSNGTLNEIRLTIEMPGLLGASSEFIPNENLPRYKSGIIKLNELTEDSILLGHIFGGIKSPSLNPFSSNQTNLTSAENHLFEVKLYNTTENTTSISTLNNQNPYNLNVFLNPAQKDFIFELEVNPKDKVFYYLTNAQGQILIDGKIDVSSSNKIAQNIKINKKSTDAIYYLTVVINDKFYLYEKILHSN